MESKNENKQATNMTEEKELWKVIKEMSDSAESGWGNSYYHIVPELINKYQLEVGAEIGVAYGGHSNQILSKTSAQLYCIDPYRHDPTGTDGYTLPDGKLFGQAEYEELYLHAMHRLQKYGTRCKFMRLDSCAAWAQISQAKISLDFVFIDAKHTFEDLYTDIYIWEKLVKKGGLIMGHDYNHESYPGVTQAVQCHFGTNVKEFHGHVWGVRKTW